MSGAYAAFRTLVPEPSDRVPITWKTFPYTLINLIPLTFMAYLVRRPDTWLIRLLLLPIIVATSLRASYCYVWMDPHLNVYNWGESLFGLVVIGKGIDFAFARGGRWKLGERRLGGMKTPAIAKREGVDAPGDGSSLKRPGASILPLWLVDALELMCAMRGFGWNFGKDVYIPKETRPLERGAFLRATALSFLWNFFLLDFLESLIKLVPGVGSPQGGTMFFAHLPPLQRYALSTFVHSCTGFAFIAGFNMVYTLLTILSVGLLHHSPTSWPPLFDAPWKADSLNEFWAMRWHQLFRQKFLMFGGYPLHFFAGRLGLVVGAFFASGLYHEFAIYAMGRGIEFHAPLFFALQGVAVIMERVWRRVTGRRVRGWIGTLWVYFAIVVVGQPCVDSWHRRGLGGGMVIPPPVSPTRQLLFPLLRGMADRLRH